MKYCLLCGTEYLDHVTHCADDGEPLVPAEDFKQIKSEPLTGPMRVLRNLEGPVHAHVVRDVLETEGIPHSIRSNVDSAYSRIFLPGKGWGVALVLEKDVERADAAVRAVMEARLEVPGDNATEDASED
jgi:hypothetical protein